MYMLLLVQHMHTVNGMFWVNSSAQSALEDMQLISVDTQWTQYPYKCLSAAIQRTGKSSIGGTMRDMVVTALRIWFVA